MRIALLAPGYPTDEAPYNHAFVHARARLYAERGHAVAAFALGDARRWTLDGVAATSGTAREIEAAITAFRPDVLAIHAPNFRSIPVAQRIFVPQVSWIHGHEAQLSLHAVHFARTLPGKAWKLIKALPRQAVQLSLLSEFLPAQKSVVFVSRWMRAQAETNTRQTFAAAEIIPNPVDVAMFSPRLDPDRRFHGVTTRSLNTRVYGLDVAIRAFSRFGGAHLTMIGTGSLEAPLRRLIEETRSNTTLEARNVPHRAMPELLSRYGFFVAPSRSESQGLAMCEAMACGLPVIATRVGGIPEFVTHMQEGLLVPPDDPETLRGAVVDLLRDESRYLAFSRNARARMEKQCAPEVVTMRELEVLRRATDG
jgi:glycosyltransferase involved in cell wall biosynthesis